MNGSQNVARQLLTPPGLNCSKSNDQNQKNQSAWNGNQNCQLRQSTATSSLLNSESTILALENDQHQDEGTDAANENQITT